MSLEFIIFILFWCVLLTFTVFALVIYSMRHKWQSEKIASSVASHQVAAQQQILVQHVKERISAHAYSSWQKAAAELSQVYAAQTNHLRLTYPDLTDLDLCVLLLLAIGLDNQEIILFLDMSKRTYYKRRQLIAGRVGLLASQLDQFAYASFA